MTEFTVEVTARAVEQGSFSALRRALETVPGTILLEDAESPVLLFPVQAPNAMQAARFVGGVAKLLGLEFAEGRIYPTPEVDFDLPTDDEEIASSTPVVDAVQDWIDHDPGPPGRVLADGTLARG
jgi:hypothetical protein